MAEPDSEDHLLIPLVAEVAVVSKAAIETSRVRVTTRVEEQQERVQVALAHDDVVVERVQVGKAVDVAPPVRMEGEVLIYPVMEEVLVVETRLMLKEELRITRRTSIETVEHEITLRNEHADVERTPIDRT